MITAVVVVVLEVSVMLSLLFVLGSGGIHGNDCDADDS